MPKLRDLPGVKARYSGTTFGERGQRILELDLPANASPQLLERVDQLMSERLAKFTTAAEQIRAVDSPEAQRARAEATRSRMGEDERPEGAGGLLLQAAAGFARSLPTPLQRDLGPVSFETSRVPEPAGVAEAVASGAGGAVGLGAQAALLEPVLAATPIFAGAGALIRAARSGAALGTPVAASTPGGVRERAIAGGTAAATAAGVSLVAPAVTGALLRRPSQSVAAARRAAVGATADFEARVAAGIERGLSRPDAVRVARGAGQRAGQRVQETFAAEAGRQTAAGRAGDVAGIAASSVGFGAIEPYARVALTNLTGEDVAMPRLEDVVQSVGALGILNLAVGARGLASRRATFTPSPEPRLGGEAPGIPGGQPGPTRPGGLSPPLEGPRVIPDRLAPAVAPLARNLGGRPMVTAGGRSELEMFRDRFYQLLPPKPDAELTAEEVRSAATQARAEVKGTSWIEAALAVPPIPEALPGRPALQAQFADRWRMAGEQATERLDQLLTGRSIEVSLPGGITGRIQVLKTAVYPWDAEQVRLIGLDEATQRVVPLRFKDPNHLRSSIRVTPESTPGGRALPPGPGQQEQLDLVGRVGQGSERGPSGTATQGRTEQPVASVTGKLQREEPAPLPEWLVASMRERGIEPARVMNDVDVKQYAELLSNDPMIAQIENRDPALAVRIRSGNVTREELRAAIEAGGPVAEPPRQGAAEPGSTTPAAGQIRMAPTEVRPARGGASIPALSGERTEESRPPAQPPAPDPFRAAFAAARAENLDVRAAIAEAERETGVSAPEGFEDEARTELRRAQEAAGQADMFGGAPMLGPAGEVGVARSEREGASIERRADLEATAAVEAARPPIYHRDVDVRNLKTHPEFQKRQTGMEAVVAERVQDYLNEHGGVNLDALRANPIKVWEDEAGAIGTKGQWYIIDGHHRYFIAAHNWAKDESGKWVTTGLAHREVPVIQIFGDYDFAKEQARLANLQGAENTYSEKAQIAFELSKRGETPEGIKRKLRLERPAQARALVDFFHVDPKVRERFFPPGAEDSRLGNSRYAAVLGSAARRHPKAFTREVQMQLIESSVRNAETLREFSDSVDRWIENLAKLPQEQVQALLEGGAGPSPLMFQASVGRVDRYAREVSESLARAANTLKRVAERKVAGVDAEAVNQMATAFRSEQKRVAEIRKEAMRRAQALMGKAAAGEPWQEDLDAIEKYVRDALGEETPADHGASTLSFMGTGPLGEWLSRQVFSGTRKAVDRIVRGLGNRGTTFRMRDAQGNVVARVPITFEVDPEREFLSYKLASHLRLGASITMPHGLLRDAYRMRAEGSTLEGIANDMIVQALGPDALKWIAHPWSARSRQAFRAMEKRGEVPPEIQSRLDRLREVLDEMLRMAQERAVALGLEPPKRLADYVPHIRTRLAPGVLDPLIHELFPEVGTDATKLEDVRNRHFEHRENDPEFQEYLLPALESYIRTWARWMATAPFVEQAKKALFDLQDTEPRRAEAVRDILRAWLFPRKGIAETLIDQAMRQLWFAQAQGNVDEVTARQVKHWLSMDDQDLAQLTHQSEKVDRFVITRGEDFRFTSREPWVQIGRTPNGNVIYGGSTGYAQGPEGPIRNKMAEWLGNQATEIRARLRGPAGGDLDERMIQEALVERERVRKLHRDPTRVVLGGLGYRNLRATLGYNLRAALANLMGVPMTSMVEWGLLPYLHGGTRFGRAMVRKGMRGIVQLLEDKGQLTLDQAATARAALPIMIEEIMAEGIGAVPGEVVQARQRLERQEKGISERRADVLELLRPMGLFAAVESVNRGMDAAVTSVVAERMGLTPQQAQRLYEASSEQKQQALRDIAADVGDPKSVAHFVAWGQAMTQYYYDMFGQALWMSGPIGKVLGQLTTFPLNYLKHQEARPLEGVVRTTAAFVKGAIGGGGKPPPPRGPAGPAPFEPLEPERMDPFSRAARRGGASWFQRHAFGVFVRSMLYAGFLLWATEATGLNFMAFGLPIVFGAALWALHALFPNDETFKRWWNRGRYGLVSPLAGAFGLVPRAMVGGFGFLAESGPRTGPIELVRRQLTGPTNLIRRSLEEFPEMFDTPALKWTYDWMDQRTALYNMPLDLKWKHHLGLLPKDVADQYRKRIHPQEKKPKPRRSFGPPIPKTTMPKLGVSAA